MIRRKTPPDHGIANLKPKEAARHPEYRRSLHSGDALRVKASSSARLTAKKPVWAPIGGADHFTIEQAREKAREAIKRIRAGQPPFEVLPPNSESF